MIDLQNLPKNVSDLGKLIYAKGFKKLPKVQKISQSGHTDARLRFLSNSYVCSQQEQIHFQMDRFLKSRKLICCPRAGNESILENKTTSSRSSCCKVH